MLNNIIKYFKVTQIRHLKYRIEYKKGIKILKKV
jgi:hypothetical protein